MAAGRTTIFLEQGTDVIWSYVKSRDGVPFDFTGYTAQMQARESYDSEDVLIDMSTDNGAIVIDGSAGKVSLIFKPHHTIGADWSRAVFDVELTAPDTTVTRFIQGTIRLSPEVTK